MITDLGHPAFAAHDVDETIGFYGMLGIEESFRLHHDDGSLMLVYLHISGDRFIEVFPGGPSPDPAREQSFMHICLLTDGLHATVEHLRENGAPIDREPAVGRDGTWHATIYLNGEELGRHHNMFREAVFDVGELVRPGENTLALLFDRPLDHVGEELPDQWGRNPERVYMRKAQFGFGWDWGPRLPTATFR